MLFSHGTNVHLCDTQHHNSPEKSVLPVEVLGHETSNQSLQRPPNLFLFDHTLFLLPPLRSPTFLIRFLFVQLHLSPFCAIFFSCTRCQTSIFFFSYILLVLKLNIKTLRFIILHYRPRQHFTTVITHNSLQQFPSCSGNVLLCGRMAQPQRRDSFVSFLWQCLLESVSKKAVRQEVAAFCSGNGTFSGPSPLPSHLQAAIVSHPPAFVSSPVKWRRLIFDTAPVSPWLQLRLFMPQKTVLFSPFDVTRTKSFFCFYAASWTHLSTAATDEIPVWQTLITTHMWKVLFEILYFFLFFLLCFEFIFYCVKLVLIQTKLFLQLLLHITSVQLCSVVLWIFFFFDFLHQLPEPSLHPANHFHDSCILFGSSRWG